VRGEASHEALSLLLNVQRQLCAARNSREREEKEPVPRLDIGATGMSAPALKSPTAVA